MGSMAASKVCKGCELEKPIEEFYPHKQSPGGFRASCKRCYNDSMKEYRRKSRVRKYLKVTKNNPVMRKTLNELAIRLLAMAFERNPKVKLTHPTQVVGNLFPIPAGVELSPGNVGPVITFQTPTQRVKKSLAFDSPSSVAIELDKWGIEIVLEGLPIPENPDHPLMGALNALRTSVFNANS